MIGTGNTLFDRSPHVKVDVVILDFSRVEANYLGIESLRKRIKGGRLGHQKAISIVFPLFLSKSPIQALTFIHCIPFTHLYYILPHFNVDSTHLSRTCRFGSDPGHRCTHQEKLQQQLGQL